MALKRFVGKQVLVTGAGSGIGRATALAFAREQAELWLTDVNEAGLAETQRLVEAAGATCHSMLCNVADMASVQVLADEVHAQVPAIDVLVNNAGIGSAGRFLEASLDTWQKVMDVNLMGVVHGCKAFLPNMVKQGGPAQVVNTASAAAFMAAPDMPIYAASKFAVLGLTESLRADLVDHNIGVTAICPGVINTDIVNTTIMEGQMGEGNTQKKVAEMYQKRNYTADQVAEVIVKAVRNNVAVQPVSPEAWGMYLTKRFSPALMSRLSRVKLPFMK